MANRSIRPMRSSLRILSALAVCVIVASAHAANNCPWMNEATASGLLGDEAVGAYSAASSADQAASCTFAESSDAAVRTLVIEVETAPDAATKAKSMLKACSSDAKTLQAIGNEAIMCSADERGGRLGEFVVGRVRDQVFAIRMSSSLKNDPILTREVLENKISAAAEQVAGNLY